MRLDEDDFVHAQYRSTAKLKTRFSVWHPDAQGRWPQDVALSALAWVKPMRLLEVGSGTGAFAASCSRELSCQVVALDSSAAMVAATGAAGVEALLGDVQDLPFPDGTFDAAVAAWMLYHVADRDLAISELARVLRPGGRLVAITNGIGHLAELWELIGAVKSESGFSRENGSEQLTRHFASVERHDLDTRAIFPDRHAASSYLATLEVPGLAERVPEFADPLIARGTPTVFVADKAG